MYPILWLFSVLVFRGMTVPKSSEPQQSWPDYTPVSPSIWDTEPSHSWATSTGSPATPTTVRYHFLVTCLIQMDTCDPKENINTKIMEYHSDDISLFWYDGYFQINLEPLHTTIHFWISSFF